MGKANTSELSILILGTGAIGSYIGTGLARNEHRVVFLERPHRVDILRKGGISVTKDGKTYTLSHPNVAGSLQKAFTLGPYDVALFALKSYHTPEMTSQLGPFRDQVPPILCLQNGVENEMILSKAFSEKAIIPGTVTSSISRRGPGEITILKERGTGIANGYPLSQPLFDAFDRAELNPTLYDDQQSMKWTKLLTNLMGNASCAILDMTPGEIYAHRGLYELEIRQLREALAVMKAQDIRPIHLPGIPSQLLAWIVETWPIPLSHPLLASVIQRGRGGKMPSFHIDLYQGKADSEVDALNGAVVRAGEKLGVSTPVNRYFHQTLLQLVEGQRPLDTYAHQPDRFIAQFPSP